METAYPTEASRPAAGSTGARWLGLTIREHLAAIAVFAVIVIAFFFPLLRGDTFSDVAGRERTIYPWQGAVPPAAFPVLNYDQDESFYPWQVFMTRSLRAGDFPLWNPYSFAGAPFFANGQSGVLYPPRMVLATTVSPTRTHDILLTTHLFFAGVAMFLLLAYFRLRFAPALVGAIAWMLNTFALVWQALEHYVVIEVWLPVGILLTHMAIRRRSWPATFGLALVLGLMFVGGNVLFVELAVATILSYAIVLALSHDLRDVRAVGGTVARLGTAVVLFAGLSAVYSLPTLRVAAESVRGALSYSQLGQFKLPLRDLANIFKQPYYPAEEPYHRDLFAGTAVGVLAVIGLLRRNGFARYCAVLALLTILYMIHTPVTWAVDSILPGFWKFKPLARAAFIFQFALAVLAAFGLDTVLRAVSTPLGQKVIRSPLLVGVIVGATVDRVVVRYGGYRLTSGSGYVIALLVGPFAAIGWELWGRHSHRYAANTERLRSLLRLRYVTIPGVLVAVIALSIVGQEWIWRRAVMPYQPNTAVDLYPRTKLIDYVSRRPGSRFIPIYPDFRGSTAMIYPIASAGGYESLLPGRIENFWRVVGDDVQPTALASNPLINAYHPLFDLHKQRPRLLARAAVDYVVAPPTSVTGKGVPRGLTLRYSGSDGRVFAVAGALPRAYLVGTCTQVESPMQALERFVSPGFAAGASVVLEQASLRSAGLSCSGGTPGRSGTAAITARSLNTLQVGVHAARPSWLVVNESWDPGWSASVDGRPAQVLPGDYTFRAVRIPEGTHVVRFRYEPKSFRAGAVISACSLAIVLVGLLSTWLLRGKRPLAGVRQRMLHRLRPNA